MSSPSDRNILQFQAFTSFIGSDFWQHLSERKLKEWKLSVHTVPIASSYTPLMRKQGGDVATVSSFPACRVDLDFSSVNPGSALYGRYTTVLNGNLTLFDTQEEFNAFNPLTHLKTIGVSISEKVAQFKDNPDGNLDITSLNSLEMVVYANLKKFIFSYWIAFPAISPTKPFHFSGVRTWSEFSSGKYDEQTLNSCFSQFQAKPFFAFDSENLKEIDLQTCLKAKEVSSNTIFGLDDPGTRPNIPGWPLRNFLYLLQCCHPDGSFNIMCLRPELSDSFVLTNVQSTSFEPTAFSVTGWESFEGKIRARRVDLSDALDPTRRAISAVKLNLDLMKWRLVPNLDLDRISSTRCLLIGAGTLGCSVARLLVGWGVKNISFVDCGEVSFSNPPRQNLYTFKDCLPPHSSDGDDQPTERCKAKVAAKRLSEIVPGLNVQGFNFAVPMPGHGLVIPKNATEDPVAFFDGLVDSHDAIFLLTDSRESRWLPTVVTAAKSKIAITAAIGFDTFLVMRHGATTKVDDASSNPRLGCYFCNDVVGPCDSQRDLSLDQQCTVSRPGVASLASSIAVELLTSILDHPQGTSAPLPSDDVPPNAPTTSFGSHGVPHQIRGFLSRFEQVCLSAHAFDKCSACSPTIVSAYRSDPNALVRGACADPDYLENLSGLAELKRTSDALADDVLIDF